MRLINGDAIKVSLQDHYGVIEQDCSISEEFANGAIAGLDASIFEINNAPTIDAIPVEWLEEHDSYGDPYGRRYITVVEALSMWRKEQEE